MECLKCIIKWLYQVVFKFGQFLQIYTFVELLAILWFLPLNRALFSSCILFFILFEDKYFLYEHYRVLEMYYKLLYRFVIKFDQFLDLKLTYFLNYCQFCDFDPSTGHLLSSGIISPSLRLNKIILDTMECLKCIIKCLYQFVFKFGQFSDFKLLFLLNYWRFCGFDLSSGPFLALWHYFPLFEAK